MIKASELRKGKLIAHEGELYTVHESRHVAKGNKGSYMQTKLRGVKSGTMIDMRFNVNDRIETPYVDTKPYEYLYRDGKDYVLMDQETFDQIHVSEDVMGDADLYLKGNEVVVCSAVDGEIVTTELPTVVELEVADTTPVVKGATATSQNKDATLETGLRVKVPPFIDHGEVLRIDTRSGEYIERAKG
ncbi:MAG: elongation factor P [Phycisphaerae bacterium]